jgi:rRNA processing protein Krr1/Pno1
VSIPREQHKFLIGRAGATLKELQERTCTRIQVPKPDANSDTVTITGPRDGIEQAVHEMQLIVDEQSKTATERLVIPKIYHPWVRGVNNELAQQEIAARAGSSGVKVNIPPPALDKDEIVVSGERAAVEIAVAEIRRIHARLATLNITKLAIQITKSQHKLIIGRAGSGVHEIFREHGVYVQVPKLDSESETIYLLGEESKLGAALGAVCARANSLVTAHMADVPTWLHRHMIGEKGANIGKITADYPATHVKFEADGRITLEGPPDEVEKVKERLENITVALKQVMVCEEVTCESRLLPALVGGGPNAVKKTENHVAKLNKEFGVVVRLPPGDAVASSTSSAASLIRIEGPPDAVAKCKTELLTLIKRLADERSKDIIIEQRFHSTLIGKSGKHLNEIRAKFNDVQVNIPSVAEKSDVVTLRGSKADVEACFKHLQLFVKEQQESGYQEELQIVKEFHKLLIGKQGAFIRRIRDETHTRIDIPAEDSNSNAILITGKQEAVRKAKKLVEEKIKVSIVRDLIRKINNPG